MTDKELLVVQQLKYLEKELEQPYSEIITDAIRLIRSQDLKILSLGISRGLDYE